MKELFEGRAYRTVSRRIWSGPSGINTCAMSGRTRAPLVLGIPFGAWSVSADANFIREKLMREVIAIAQKKGIDLSEKDMEKQASVLKDVPPKINRPPSRTLRQAARPRWKCSEAPSSVWAVSWECLRLIMKCSTMELKCWSRRMRGCLKENAVSAKREWRWN